MKKLLFVVLIGSVALGGFLRFSHLEQRGIFNHDEAIFLEEARFLKSASDLLFSGHLTLKKENFEEGELRSLKSKVEGNPLGTARPTHTLLLWVAMLCFGDRETSGLTMSAFLGALSLLFVFLIGKSLFGMNEALVSTFLLAVSPYHIYYSRSLYSEIDASFFILLATYLYLKSREEGKRFSTLLFLSGFCLGLSATTNYRWAFVPIFFLLYELHFFFVRKNVSWQIVLKRSALAGLGTLLPIFLYELPYRLLGHRSGLPGTLPMSYLEQLTSRVRRFGGTFGVEGWTTYFFYFSRLENVFFLVFAILGLLLLFFRFYKRKFPLPELIVISQFALPFVFFSFYFNWNYRYPRTIALVLPAAAWAAGFAICRLGEKFSKKDLVIVGITVILVLIGGVRSSRFLGLSSGYQEAARHSMEVALSKKKKIVIDDYHAPIWKYYAESLLRGKGVSYRDLFEESSGNQKKSLIIDCAAYANVTSQEYNFLRKISPERKPLFVIANNIGREMHLLCDLGVPHKELFDAMKDPTSSLISVYEAGR
ncbi:MAG: glycosyltransferase family 39 protein [Candidatus Omnitrophica bacterium]|nr:glycosyltransferase family 39 protein [Candidatus Omnitrophota bacterium]